MSRSTIVLSGRNTPRALSVIERGVVDLCRDGGIDCVVVPPICHIAESSELWASLAERLEGAVLLCWIHPRPAEWLLHRHQIECKAASILNLADFSDAAAVVQAVTAVGGGKSRSSAKGKSRPGNVEQLGEAFAERWFPVLDGDRCVNCQHCLQFCLFGVYELDDEERVAVRRPDQCKPGCPACSRICSQSAIMFPLYKKDAAIAGAPGQFVELDAEGRKMFYERTGRRCPRCGQTGEVKRRRSKTTKEPPCPECGRPQPRSEETSQKTETTSADNGPLPFDDLDDLVDQLDKKTQRRR